uniref:Coiled-coil domain containing 43 n=1 Tax=Hucho hucho TaxID=62062 RepID=A0A4W5MZR4_9TELE
HLSLLPPPHSVSRTAGTKGQRGFSFERVSLLVQRRRRQRRKGPEDEKLEDVCKEIISQWAESCARSATKNKEDAEVLAIANLIEKQAQIVVKQKEVSQESRKRKEAKEAVLAQYANITDDEDEAEEEEQAFPPSGDKSLFKNTNVEEVLSRKKQQRDQAKEDSHKKKETDKMQREKDKLARQDRKDKEKKRTQKGERKR